MVVEPPAASPSRRILVADDEPHIRRVLETLLSTAGFTVDEAADGREAIAMLDGSVPYDCILLDLMMPYASGLDVLQHVRKHPAHWHTPVVILTAKGQDADREAAIAAGTDDFLTKPFSPKKLLARIEEMIAGH
ncbi:MAG: response regulator transcription factor [Gemmatimonadota bacterium]